MLELKKALEQRIIVLKGGTVKSDSKAITNISKEYITYTLTKAGILDEQGEIRDFKISE